MKLDTSKMEVRTLSKYILKHGTFYEVDDCLRHAHVPAMAKKPKYYAKVENGKTIRYFYSKDEWLAYKNKGTNTNVEPKSKKKSATLATTGSTLEKSDKSSKSASRIASIVKKAIEYVKEIGNKRVDTVVDETETAKNDAEKAPSTNTTGGGDKTSITTPSEITAEWAEGLKHKETPTTPDEDQALINPNYTGEYDDPYTNNCAYCTTAYDLRRRGYDVEALPYDESIQPPTDIEGLSRLYQDTTVDDWSKTTVLDVDSDAEGDEWTVNKQYSEAIKSLWTELPDGSYGQLSVVWKMGGGHSLVWEKTDGEVTIRDCQTNEAFMLNEKAHEFSYLTNAVYAIRTDNREPSEEITNYVRNREERDR